MKTGFDPIPRSWFSFDILMMGSMAALNLPFFRVYAPNHHDKLCSSRAGIREAGILRDPYTILMGQDATATKNQGIPTLQAGAIPKRDMTRNGRRFRILGISH